MSNHSHRCPQCGVLWICPIVSHCFRAYEAVCMDCIVSKEVDEMVEYYDQQSCRFCGSIEFVYEGDRQVCADCQR